MYVGHADTIKCPNNCCNPTENPAMQARVRSWHKTLNSWLKNWLGTLGTTYRHNMLQPNREPGNAGSCEVLAQNLEFLAQELAGAPSGPHTATTSPSTGWYFLCVPSSRSWPLQTETPYLRWSTAKSRKVIHSNIIYIVCHNLLSATTRVSIQ